MCVRGGEQTNFDFSYPLHYEFPYTKHRDECRVAYTKNILKLWNTEKHAGLLLG